jgi:hypothetical protein
MFCTNCGQKQASDALFCQFCGTKLPIPTSNFPVPELEESTQPYYPPTSSNQTNSSGTGFGIVGLILGALSTVIALYDFGLVASGEFSYVAIEEVALLLFMSSLGTIFSGIGTSKKSSAAIAGLIFSILGLFLALLLTTLT